MEPAISSFIELCAWAPSHFLIISENVFNPLIYYSHLLPIICSLLLGIVVFIGNRKDIAARVLFFITSSISLWLLADLILWADPSPDNIMFFWSLLILFEPIIYAAGLYFLYVFIDNKPPPLIAQIALFLILLPTIALVPTTFGITAFNLANCDREVTEGILVYYGYAIEVIISIWIVIYGVLSFLKKKKERGQIVLTTVALSLFLFALAFGNIVGSFSENWELGQYGLFGIPIFVALLAYLITRFRAFNIKLIFAQVLVASLWLLTCAILFVEEVSIIRIIVSITLILFLFLGYLLVQNVRREILQRERIEILAKDLDSANRQQIILIHFITHQIKGFMTKSRNIFSLFLDGDYGPIPENLRPMIEEGFRSDTKGVNTIQEILNAANIKSGKVIYNMSDVDLKAIVEEVSTDLRAIAEGKGLAFNLELGDAPVMVKGDRLQLLNALKNLIDNSIKYTLTGSVTVKLAQEAGKIRFVVEDTGVGITKEDMHRLFTEGGHGTNSQKVNVESTGFGLYIVKNIIEAHHGKVWAESEGENKGSRFIAELPA